MIPRTPLDHAHALLTRGLSPIPIPPKSKRAVIEGWPALRLTVDDLPRYFNGAPSNLGTLLGEPSGWIVDVDLDHPRAVELADSFLPQTGMVWGRESKPRSHRLYRLTRGAKTKKWERDPHGSILELRSTGCQTVAPGSTHPSGEAVRWDDDGAPALIDPDDLISSLEALVAAVLAELRDAPPDPDRPTRLPIAAPAGGGGNYGREALRREASQVAGTSEGGRNDALNRAAFNIGTLIGGGEIDRTEAEAELLAAARVCGLPDGEARRTTASGIESGMKHPRQRPSQGGISVGKRHAIGGSGDAPAAGFDKSDQPAQAEQLARLASDIYTLGRTPTGEPFAVLKGGPNVALRMTGNGGAMRDTLARAYRKTHGRIASATALADALTALRGEAAEAPTQPTYLRVGPFNAGIVLDLGTPDGAAVVVDATGWQVVDRSPILFQRTALTGELPTPVRGGKIDALRDLLNMTDETWPILLGWMVAAMIPEMPHPILMLGGQQGTGKTTAAKFICGVFDPSDAPTISQPRDPEGWAMIAANTWTTTIDNVSTIPDWWSDALCKAVTGDGWIRRTLYTDGDVSVLTFRRVIVLTSIDAGALRGDLGERLVLVDLQPIPRDKRRAERDLVRAYRDARPAMLGALLDLLAGVLASLDSIHLPELPRMADFARVLAAMDASAGTNALATYNGQGTRIASDVIDADPVIAAVVAMVLEAGSFEGTAGALLERVRPEQPGREWPRHPRGMCGRLKRAAPAMEAVGIRMTPPRPGDKARRYFLQATAQTAQPPRIGAGDAVKQTPARAVDQDDRPVDRPTAHTRPSGKVDSEAVAGPLGDSGGSGGSLHPSTGEVDGWAEVPA